RVRITQISVIQRQKLRVNNRGDACGGRFNRRNRGRHGTHSQSSRNTQKMMQTPAVTASQTSNHTLPPKQTEFIQVLGIGQPTEDGLAYLCWQWKTEEEPDGPATPAPQFLAPPAPLRSLADSARTVGRTQVMGSG